MEAKHTPGPWFVEPEEASEHRGIAICAADATVATILPEEDGPALDETDWANARLIAAAPDLLAALEKIDSNAAESAEWIRSVIRPVIAKGKASA
jgi:hypothetical protein